MTKKIVKKVSNNDLVLALQELLHKNTVGTQAEIQTALQKKGYVVNQVKISRMLHKLGVAKIIENNNIVYRLPHARTSVTPNDTLISVINSIQHNEYLIVIKTMPGSAQLVAHILDHKDNLDVLGTVAGDDTIFITPASTKKIHEVYDRIYKILLG